MKRVLKSVRPPTLLQKFSKTNPNADWEKFRGSKKRRTEVATQLKKDQHGLCAYCEIDFLESTEEGKLNDFRVEHFHPKSPHQPPPNWALDWDNLLGVCHGGSQSDVIDPTRFDKDKTGHSCDVPKNHQNWTGIILNPLIDIPADVSLFKYSESSGKIETDPIKCPPELIEKSIASIDRLNLNSPRLLNLRKEILAALSDQIAAYINDGIEQEVAMREVAAAQFAKDAKDQWPRFFTCVRWYLGPAAEDELKHLGYQG